MVVPATRWFDSDPASVLCITTTAGQRAVAMEDTVPTPIIVRDFNPYTPNYEGSTTASESQLERTHSEVGFGWLSLWRKHAPRGLGVQGGRAVCIAVRRDCHL
jgi:hypothetical protein